MTPYTVEMLSHLKTYKHQLKFWNIFPRQWTDSPLLCVGSVAGIHGEITAPTYSSYTTTALQLTEGGSYGGFLGGK